ncbi:A Disintegrin And Metalloproteinase With Thrombospondin Motifs 17 [Manis pentadactyla]|nr:A Disintegrin And Metalloproteinase With Thrombospondin Motifs 17 [Manis pentadactyla]
MASSLGMTTSEDRNVASHRASCSRREAKLGNLMQMLTHLFPRNHFGTQALKTDHVPCSGQVPLSQPPEIILHFLAVSTGLPVTQGWGQASDPGIQLEPKSKGVSTLAMIKATPLQLAADPLGPRIQDWWLVANAPRTWRRAFALSATMEALAIGTECFFPQGSGKLKFHKVVQEEEKTSCILSALEHPVR